MKIGIISQWYEPERGSGAHPTAIAEALRDRGHDVRVLTGFPSYPEGRVHSGYSMKLRLRETHNGIELLRVPDVPSHDQSALRRALTLTSFAVSACTQVGWLRDRDVVLTYLTPATVGLAPWALQLMTKIPYVLYVQDLWPETVVASGFIGNDKASAAVERGINRALRKLYHHASGVVAISPTMAETLASRGATTPPVSVPNWVDEKTFVPAAGEWQRTLPADRTWLMYAGGVGELQALQHAIRAVHLLSGRPDIGLAIVGDGVARPGLERMACGLGVDDRVLFLGSRPMEEMPRLMAEAAAQLVSLRDLPLFAGTIPSKIQAAMACGSPIVCAVAGDAARLVAETDSGVVVPPETDMALAEAFVRMVDAGEEARGRWGANARRAYVEELSAAAGAERLEQVLSRAVESVS
ncbi:glycosyltransferase family 4 protein [uncultured Nocardioides sp.]|uniref:glycosyltransferase family 4 protein n=1 Tax=uncultured Nocardioides sp. TaxID=198441 RepID=UPI002627C84F|nr:glycosyltransferase family 4 protein [uncultured Nocardioides sp.]